MYGYIKWLIKHNLAPVVYLIWALSLPVFVITGIYIGIKEIIGEWLDDLKTLRHEIAQFKKTKEVK